MEAWVEAAEAGENLDDLIPVKAPPTPANVEQLKGRLQFLRTEILPLVKAN